MCDQSIVLGCLVTIQIPHWSSLWQYMQAGRHESEKFPMALAVVPQVYSSENLGHSQVSYQVSCLFCVLYACKHKMSL